MILLGSSDHELIQKSKNTTKYYSGPGVNVLIY